MTSLDKFQAAVNVIQNLPKDGPYQPSNDMKLKFYGLYKQATEGPCTEPKPAFYEVIKGYKWKAWKGFGDMTKEDAMSTYVEELKKIIETMSYTKNVADFVESLGPFFEYVDISKSGGSNNEENIIVDLQNGIFGSTGTESSLRKIIANGNIFENELCNADAKYSNGSRKVDVENGDILSFANGVAYSSEEHSPDLLTSTNAVNLVSSESESDEEYSEPAEILIGVTNLSETQETVMHEFSLTCGGSDQSHPGGLQKKDNITYQNRESSLPLYASGSLSQPRFFKSQGNGNSGGGSRRPDRQINPSHSEDINLQLLMILQRMQLDLQSVLRRLDSIERITVLQNRTLCSNCQHTTDSVSPENVRSWWPFPELSPRSTFFLLVWPFILHGGVKLFLALRSRRKKV